MGMAHGWRGWALALQGQGEAGLAQMHQGLATIWPQGRCWRSRAVWSCRGGRRAHWPGGGGTAPVGRGLTALEASGQGDLLAEAYRLQGEFLLGQALPDASQAEANFQQALAVARRQQAKSWELRAALSLCRLWQRQGKRAAARELLAPIYSWFTGALIPPTSKRPRHYLQHSPEPGADHEAWRNRTACPGGRF